MSLFGFKKNEEHVNKEYIIKGIEESYNAFDDWENDNKMAPIVVKASSIDDAVAKGMKILQAQIYKSRKEAGYMTHGTFIAHVNEVLDMEGNVLYKNYIRRNV